MLSPRSRPYEGPGPATSSQQGEARRSRLLTGRGYTTQASGRRSSRDRELRVVRLVEPAGLGEVAADHHLGRGRRDSEHAQRAVHTRMPAGVERAGRDVGGEHLVAHDRILAVRPGIADVVEVTAGDELGPGDGHALDVAVNGDLPELRAA